MFLSKEAVRLALSGVATGVACAGCPPLPELLDRYERAGGRYMVCPICFEAKMLPKDGLVPNAEIAGTVAMWEWIGDDLQLLMVPSFVVAAGGPGDDAVAS
jgi:predicted peroxiredoxin